MESGNGVPPSEKSCQNSRTDGLPNIKPSNTPNLEDANIALAKYLCSASISPHSACNGAFRQFINALNPNLKTDLETLESHCLNIYREEGKRLKDTFSKLEGRISLSFDIPMYMTNTVSREFMCLAAHFVDNDWKLQRRVIRYCRSNLDPAIVTFKAMQNFGIEGKVFALTSGATKGFADLQKVEVEETLEVSMDDHTFHYQISCSDIISKMMYEAFKDIIDITSKVELLSWSKSLPLWYLTSSKLSNALELEALGEFSSENVDSFYEIPSKEEWDKVKSICRIANHMYNIVKGLFEIKRPSANLFLPHLHEIRDYLLQQSASDDEFVTPLTQKMLKTFNEYWEDVCVVLAIAAFVDPRYKMKFIEFSFSMPECSDGESKVTYLMEIIHKLYDGYLAQSNKKEYLLVDSSSDIDEDDEEFEAEESHPFTLNILSNYRQSVKSTNGDQPDKTDLDLYVEEPVLPWTDNFDVLLWWKDHCSKYPNVSKMARDFLAIPLSVASDFEAYYIEPREPDRTVQGLKSSFTNALMCTRCWKLDKNKH